MFLYFLQGLTLGISASTSPGPFQAFLLSQTLQNGWRRTLPVSMAPLLGDIPIVLLILLVLTRTPDWFLNGLQIAGGLFLLFLARGAFLSLRTRVDVSTEVLQAPLHQNFFKGAFMNSLSPGPYIFWSVLAGPIVLEAWRQSPGLGMSFVAGFYGTLISGFALFVILFATAGHFDPKFSNGLRGVSAVALLLFGLYQLWTGIFGLVG